MQCNEGACLVHTIRLCGMWHAAGYDVIRGVPSSGSRIVKDSGANDSKANTNSATARTTNSASMHTIVIAGTFTTHAARRVSKI